MKKHMREYMKTYLVVIDVLTVLISFCISIALRFGIFMVLYDLKTFDGVILLSVGIIVLFGLLSGVYDGFSRYFGIKETITQLIISFLPSVFIVVLYFIGIPVKSISMLIMFGFIYFIFSCAIHGSKRLMNYYQSVSKFKKAEDIDRTLIIGAGETGAVLSKHLLENPIDKLKPIGFLDDDYQKIGKYINGIKVLGKIDDCEKFMQKYEVDKVIIAITNMNAEQSTTIYSKITDANHEAEIETYSLNTTAGNDAKTIKKVAIEDLLFREPIKTTGEKTYHMVADKVVVVTGGAGSIGSELCRQILENNPKFLIICDINENGLYEINEEFKNKYPNKYQTYLASVRDRKRLRVLFEEFKPELVFHAAAHKHVPMMEINPFEAVKNNVFGTYNLIQQAIESGVSKFVLISTDKAVRPTNVMGATKRMCELLVKIHSSKQTEMVAVRFGNVLGSNGSVIPLFQKQIKAGGPLTVTDKEMTRYFMTIKEAVSLVLAAGASAKGSELFVLDMGKPIKIYDLALNLIKLSGKIPFEDIDIKITGLRPGEKMYEELLLDNEVVTKTENAKIFVMKDQGINKDNVYNDLQNLNNLIGEQSDGVKLKTELLNIIGKYEEA